MFDLRKLDHRRRQLGLSREGLARRAKVSVPTVHRILTGKEPAPSIKTVAALAGALGLRLELAEVRDVDTLREEQANRRAAELVGMVQGTMGLEAQAVDAATIESLKKRRALHLLAGSNRRLWSE